MWVTTYLFPQLLDDERFKSVDKIKTVGSTFMAAVGLMPEMRILDHKEESASYYLSVLAELVFALREKLANINENSYNSFTLRVGECCGYPSLDSGSILREAPTLPLKKKKIE